MTNPPIPPRCPCFVPMDEDAFLFIAGTNVDNKILVCLGRDVIPADLRFVIAAAAEVGWRKIGEQGSMEAYRNADAWRKWGYDKRGRER